MWLQSDFPHVLKRLNYFLKKQIIVVIFSNVTRTGGSGAVVGNYFHRWINPQHLILVFFMIY